MLETVPQTVSIWHTFTHTKNPATKTYMELWERGAAAAPSATPWSSFIWSVFYVFVRLALYLLILFFPCFASWLLVVNICASDSLEWLGSKMTCNVFNVLMGDIKPYSLTHTKTLLVWWQEGHSACKKCHTSRNPKVLLSFGRPMETWPNRE